MPIPPNWLVEVLEDAPRGLQARLARAAKMTTDQLSKVKTGIRGLTHEEAEALRMAIETDRRPAPAPVNDSRSGSGFVERVVARRHGKPPQLELAFFLKGAGLFVFQLDPDREAQLLKELAGAS